METLDSIFENSARSNFNNIAITFNSGSTKEDLTYRAVNEKACKVAEFLKTVCEKHETVALYSKQSIGCVVSILGVLKNKGCFAPVDLQWLPETMCNFLSNLNVRLVLVAKELLESFKECLRQSKHSLAKDYQFEVEENAALDMNGFVLVRKLLDFKLAAVSAEPLDLAYVMQTSGTTGEPKAVKVPHRCIVPNVTDLREIFQLVSDDVVYLASPYTFDPSIVQMFMAFAAGARLVLVPERVKMAPSKLCQILFDEERVTILQPTPSLMHFIGQDLIQSKILASDSSLRVLAFGGESCPTLSTLRAWRPPGSKTLMYNLYGITEVSCWASCYHIPNDQLEFREIASEADNGNWREKSQDDFPVGIVSDVPLGLPLSNTVIEIRDENNELIKEGIGQIYIGCYDGKVYAFNRFTGDTHWTFQTDATVKSSPCTDSQTGLTWVGSHDHHLYGLDIKRKHCVCTVHCGGGSCFSSPCISHEPHLVFIATLTGRVVAVDADEHTVLWSQQCPKPVFASPLLIPCGVVCACVDGLVYCFDFQGRETWRFETGAPIFCSPAYTRTEWDSDTPGYIVFGSHDKRVYCLSVDGKMQWSFMADGQVYSSPFVTQLNFKRQTGFHSRCHVTCKTRHTSHAKMAVFVLSTVGTLFILELKSGILLGSYSLPREVFSSPVVTDQQVLLGCRNNYIYSLKVNQTAGDYTQVSQSFPRL